MVENVEMNDMMAAVETVVTLDTVASYIVNKRLLLLQYLCIAKHCL